MSHHHQKFKRHRRLRPSRALPGVWWIASVPVLFLRPRRHLRRHQSPAHFLGLEMTGGNPSTCNRPSTSPLPMAQSCCRAAQIPSFVVPFRRCLSVPYPIKWATPAKSRGYLNYSTKMGLLRITVCLRKPQKSLVNCHILRGHLGAIPQFSDKPIMSQRPTTGWVLLQKSQ